MVPRKLKIAIARFPYGGNGATSQEIPEIGTWLMRMGALFARDERIEQPPGMIVLADTPITMTRNRAMAEAHKAGADLLLWVDSDNAPDLYLGLDPSAKSFFESTFDFMYDRWEKGPSIVFAPYCGPPPHPIKGGESCVYVFQWRNRRNTPHDENCGLYLEKFTREEAAMRTGFELVAAGPTGMMMIDLRAINFTSIPDESLVNPPWFDYEWKDPPFNTEKASTEDVYFTRNATLAGIPVYCNWDAWVGHAKPEMVGKPIIITTDRISKVYRDAVLRNIDGRYRVQNINSDKTPAEIAAEYGLPAPLEIKAVETMTNAEGFTFVGMANPEADMAALRRVVNCAVETHDGELPIRIAEVGTWVGQSALEILKCSEDIELHCVDTWEGSKSDPTAQFVRDFGGREAIYKVFKSNMATKKASYVVWPMTSLEAAEQAAKQGYQFDLVYIDADHQQCDQDIKAWLPLVKPGGILAGHDYEPVHYQKVIDDVHEAFGNDVEVQGTVWAHIVKESDLPACKEPACAQ